MSRRVFIVMRSTGEYSDRRELPVRAFLDQSKAEELVINADAKARELLRLDHTEQRYMGPDANEFDPGMSTEDGDPTYFIHEVELDD